MKSIVIGTAGHIDHGKTTLVRALTGIDTDRLPEEKLRGITIDLGFAVTEMLAPDGSPLRISFVDVPGHALFIRNMLAGAGCVAAVMLVIAADEGVMPQTREHLAICDLLGISDGFTVISKSDRVPASELGAVQNRIARFLEGTFLDRTEKPILLASAQTNTGISEVRAELGKLAMRARHTGHVHPLRLPIDRTFVKKGFGTVVTGTLLSGEIELGQKVTLEPGARKARVRGLHSHGESVETACPGTRVAVNLAGIEVDEITRGQTLVVPGELTAVDVVDVEVTLLQNASALAHRARVHLHAFTSETMATVLLFGKEAAQPRTARLARLKLSNPVVLAPGDRFVLRQPLPVGTLGGGRVLDCNPVEHEHRAETEVWLKALAGASLEQCLVLRIRRHGATAIPLNLLAQEMGLDLSAVKKMAAWPLSNGAILAVEGGALVAREAFEQVARLVLGQVSLAGRSGLKRSELYSRIKSPTEVLEAVIDRLIEERKLQPYGEAIALTGANTDPVDRDQPKLQRIATEYQSAGLAPPAALEIARRLGLSEVEMRRLVTVLLRERVLIRMGDDVFVHRAPLHDLASRLALERGKVLNVTDFKTITGLTRKHAIPLLELLDRERLTRKQGDVRVVL